MVGDIRSAATLDSLLFLKFYFITILRKCHFNDLLRILVIKYFKICLYPYCISICYSFIYSNVVSYLFILKVVEKLCQLNFLSGTNCPWFRIFLRERIY